MNDLTLAVTITGVNEKTIHDALASGLKDLEDAIQYFSAVQFGNIDAIITRNPKDFKKAHLPVMTSAAFLALTKKP